MDDNTAALLVGLGRAQLATLPPREWGPPVAGMQRAFEHYAAAGDIGRAIAVAAPPVPLVATDSAKTTMPELVARGLTLVRPDSLDEGRLLTTHGWLAGFTGGDYDEAQQSFRRALAIAEQQDDGALERRTLTHAAFVECFHLRWHDCLTKGLRAIELARNAGDLHNEMAASRIVGWAATVMGDSEQARLHAAAALALAERIREAWWLVGTSFNDGLVSAYTGEWRAAREMSELGFAVQPEDPRHLTLRAVLDYELGELEEGTAYIQRLQEAAQRVPPPGPIGGARLCSPPDPGPEPHRRRRRSYGRGGGGGRPPAVGAGPQSRPGPRNTGGIGADRRATGGDAGAAGELYGAIEPQTGHRVLLSPAGLGSSPGAARRHLRQGRDGPGSLRGRARVLRARRLPPRARLDGVGLRRSAARARRSRRP